jgi:hypothetical protein
MYSDILCAVTLKDESISDLLAASQELDVSSLKDDVDAKLSEEEQQEEAAAKARLVEIATIQEFFLKKKAFEAANPIKAEKKEANAKKAAELNKKKINVAGRGRPRKSYTKAVSFMNVKGAYKLAGRGRPKAGETRTKFELFYTHAAAINSERLYTSTELRNLAKK